MAANLDTNEDESFIILGTSPGSSLDVKCGSTNGDVHLDKSNLEDALKDLSDEANMAFKAHFELGDCPSPASMMVASTMVTDDVTTEELQKRFGELLDENVILKETLKQNNDSMKEQFLLIASCQEDMMRTQTLHKEKFEETKELVQKLRSENKKLKADLVRKVEAEAQTSMSTDNSGPSSGLEFVTSPDDDTVNKLTAQLELVEKQRRQVLVDNEKLTWQKESLEHIVDATSKERDELKEKLQNLELQLSSKDSSYSSQINSLKSTMQDLQSKLLSANSISSVSSEEMTKRDATIQKLEAKVSRLQAALKESELRVFELENVRLEFTKHKSEQSETTRLYKEQIQELQNRLKDAQITVFQPVRVSLSSEREGSPSDSEFGGLMSNVRLYDRTLKHLADLMNALTNGLTDGLVATLRLVASLHDFKLEKTTVDQFKSGLGEVKQQLEKQHNNALSYVVQVRSTLSIFEGIFKDYNELLKKTLTKQEQKPPAPNVEALTSALLARGEEVSALQAALRRLRDAADDAPALRAQLEVYRSDFEAEREAREKMACEKENVTVDLRTAQRRIQELVLQLDEVKNLNPDVFWTATTKRNPQPSAPTTQSSSSRTGNTSGASSGNTSGASNGATKKKVYTCPKCNRFKCSSYPVMEDHLDYCLNNDLPCNPV